MRILVLEPYYGGSHKYFLDNLAKNVEAEFFFLTLPARKWKMRMQLSAPWFIDRIKEMAVEDRYFHTVLCSTFVDVALFRALAGSIDGWNTGIRYCTYFHENQFVYPNQQDGSDTFQFTAINFNTALASGALAFNSEFNKQTFFAGCGKFLKSAGEIRLKNCLAEIERKSSVIYPGIEYSEVDNSQPVLEKDNTLTIVWNHRWEHDKNPEEFFTALYRLKERNVRFKLIVLGESFRAVPDCFQEAKKNLADEIVHFGYAEDKAQYYGLLQGADIVVSTAIHEFFGIAVLEAVRAGCHPVLPKRLSYPELFDGKYLYDEGKLAVKLEKLIRNYDLLSPAQKLSLTEKYSWHRLKKDYQQWLLPVSKNF